MCSGGLVYRADGLGVFGEADFGAGFGVGADGLDAEAVGEDGVVRDLGDLAAGETEAGGAWRPSR